MRKLNNRPILFSVISAMFGVVFSSYSLFSNLLLTGILFLIFLTLVLALVDGDDGMPKVFLLPLLLIFFAFGFFIGEYSETVYNKTYCDQSGEITVKVLETNDWYFVGEEISVDGESVEGKVLGYYQYSYSLEAGDIVTYSGDLTKIPIFEDGELSYQFSSGITYKSNVYEITESYHKFEFKTYIKSYILSAQTEMFGENAGIAYAMTFGDSSFAESETLSLLRSGGIAHLFAVSGLHIGIFFGLLQLFSWLKPRSPLNQKVLFNVIVSLFLLFYVYLCDFSTSSVRAFLMIVVVFVLSYFGVVKDKINTIAITAFILLVKTPYILFTVGYQLSFLTVFGLAVLPKKIAKGLKFIKNEKFKNAVSWAVSAFLSTSVVSLYHFGYISTISILLNLLLVPVYTAVYVLNLFGLFIYLVCDLLNLATLSNWVFPYFTGEIYNWTILLFEKIETVFPLAVYFDISIYVVIFAYAIMLCFSSLANVKTKSKLLFSWGMATLMLLFYTFGGWNPFVGEQNVWFFENDTQPLTIQTESRTYIFANSGGTVDFSTVGTKDVSLIIFDDYYSEMEVSGYEDLNITIYAEFKVENETANSLLDFMAEEGEVTLSEDWVISYAGLQFEIGTSSVTVYDADGENIIKNGDETEYFIKNSILCSENLR